MQFLWNLSVGIKGGLSINFGRSLFCTYGQMVELDSEFAENRPSNQALHSRKMTPFRTVDILFRAGGKMQLVHDGYTGELTVFYETDENGDYASEPLKLVDYSQYLTDEEADELARTNLFEEK